MVFRQCLKTGADVVEMIDFAQDRFKSHTVSLFWPLLGLPQQYTTGIAESERF